MKKARVGVIVCHLPGSFKMTFGRGRYTKGSFLEKKIRNLGKRYEPLIHCPAADKKDFPDIKKVDAVIIPGSKENLDDESISQNEWMQRLLGFITDVHEKVPMLGICFGHQAIARAFGSGINRFAEFALGFDETVLTNEGKKNSLLETLPEKFTAAYAHYYYIGKLPESAVLLAKSADENNKSMQAFSIGKKTYGVQFHPEYSKQNITEIMDSGLFGEDIREKVNLSVKERADRRIIPNFLQLI